MIRLKVIMMRKWNENRISSCNQTIVGFQSPETWMCSVVNGLTASKTCAWQKRGRGAIGSSSVGLAGTSYELTRHLLES